MSDPFLIIPVMLVFFAGVFALLIWTSILSAKHDRERVQRGFDVLQQDQDDSGQR